jgi:hypothetical protein
MNNLVEAKKMYFQSHPNQTPMTKGIPFQEFIVECIGTSYPERRAHRDRIKARKNNKLPYVIKYDPALPKSRKSLDHLQLRMPLGHKKTSSLLKDVEAKDDNEEVHEHPMRERGDHESIPA